MDSDSDGEYLVSYGTPLQDLEEDEPLPKPIAIQDQVVKDRQGRQRFHGAFTGGFSAGFFNTVGSKEGFTPSTFVSSRGNRADQHSQRPEHYMDDDDMGEYGIAPKKVMATRSFAGEPGGGKKRAVPISSIIPDDGRIQNIIRPTDETTGIRLLRRMGWKPGQGIGPKIERQKRNRKTRNKRRQEGQKVYGCVGPPGLQEDTSGGVEKKHKNEIDDETKTVSSEDDKDDEEDLMRGFLFAPDDIQDFIFALKDDVHGIGYHGIDSSRSVLGGHITLFEDPVKSRDSRRQGISGHAFGVGAFEEDEDDDVYSSDRLSNYDRVLGGEEDIQERMFGWTGPPPSHSADVSSVEGFKAASQKELSIKVFHPPTLPRDFRPFHQFKSSAVSAETEARQTPAPSSSRFTLSATQRAAVLGEQQLPGPTIDELLKEVRHKASTSQATPPQISMAVQHPSSQCSGNALSRWDRGDPQSAVPTHNSTAKGTGSGFKPFAVNPDKQRRYEEYVERKRLGIQANTVTTGQADRRTEWERSQEQDEFSRAASLYQPISGMMASRFVSAKHADSEDCVEVPKETTGEVSDQTSAAEMSMFGQLTRDTLEWHPDKLLCKRFNVADPYPGSTIVGLPVVKKDRFSLFNLLEVQQQSSSHIDVYPDQDNKDPSSAQSGNTSEPSLSSQKRSRWDQHPGILAMIRGQEDTEADLDDSQAQVVEADQTGILLGGDEEEQPRPPKDLYQAIFMESNTSSDSSDYEEHNEGVDVAQRKEEGSLKLSGTMAMKGSLVATKTDSVLSKIENKDPDLDDRGEEGTQTTEQGAEWGQRKISSNVAAMLSHANHASSGDRESDKSWVTGGPEGSGEEEMAYGPVLPPSTSQSHNVVDLPIRDTALRHSRNVSDQRSPVKCYKKSDKSLPKSAKRHSRHRSRSRSKGERRKEKRKKKNNKDERKERSHRRNRSKDGNEEKQNKPSREESSREKGRKKARKSKHRHQDRTKSPSRKLSKSAPRRRRSSSSDYGASPSSEDTR